MAIADVDSGLAALVVSFVDVQCNVATGRDQSRWLNTGRRR